MGVAPVLAHNRRPEAVVPALVVDVHLHDVQEGGGDVVAHRVLVHPLFGDHRHPVGRGVRVRVVHYGAVVVLHPVVVVVLGTLFGELGGHPRGQVRVDDVHVRVTVAPRLSVEEAQRVPYFVRRNSKLFTAPA